MIWICPACTLDSLFSGRNYTLRKFILEGIACGIGQCHKSFVNVPIASVYTHLLYMRSPWDTSFFFPNCKVHIAEWWFCLWAHSKGGFDDEWDKFIRIYCSNCGWFLQQQLKPVSSKFHSCYCFPLIQRPLGPMNNFSCNLCNLDPKIHATITNPIVHSLTP